MRFLKIFAALGCLLSALPAVAADNYEPPADPIFPKPDYFRNHLGKAPLRVELQPPARLREFVTGGKIVLSLKSYLDLVMANNPDIGVQKVMVETYANAITRAFSVFDPLATASFSSTRVETPTTSSLQGASTLNTLTQPLNLQVSQTVATGGQYNVSYAGTKFSTNSAFATYNPSLTSSLLMNFSQPLLRGRGVYITKLPITIARSRLQQNELLLHDQVIQLVSAAESAYWDVVEARESLRVQREALKLSDAALKRTRRELELGATSPLDIYQPEQQFANAQLSVAQAEYYLQQVETTLRRQMGVDLDPSLRALPLQLTESVAALTSGLDFDNEDTVHRAFRTRYDLRGLRQAVDIDDLNVYRANDAMRPYLALTASYGSFGQGGPFYQRNSILDAQGNPSTSVSVIPGGIGDSLNQLFGFGYPTYAVGLSLQLPLRDRNATANLADALTNRKIDQLHVRSTEENVRLQVLNALTAVKQSRDSIDLAGKVREFAVKRVEAEQKRYDLGTTTIFFVLQAQTDLTTAEANLVHQSILLKRNLLTLYQSTGELLEQRGIALTP